MEIQKIEVDSNPGPFEVLSVVRSNYRSGQKFEIQVHFNWGFSAEGTKFRGYTKNVSIEWDRKLETLLNLKKKAIDAFDLLKAADTNEADTIFNLLHLTI